MNHEQFTLPFLDTTIAGDGFGLYGEFPTAKSSAQAQMNFKAEEDEALDAPVPTQPSLPAQDHRLVGDRRLAENWKGRAEDNLAAIQLMAERQRTARHGPPAQARAKSQPSQCSRARRRGQSRSTSARVPSASSGGS
jgi:hypothetical protein